MFHVEPLSIDRSVAPTDSRSYNLGLFHVEPLKRALHARDSIPSEKRVLIGRSRNLRVGTFHVERPRPSYGGQVRNVLGADKTGGICARFSKTVNGSNRVI